MTRWWLRMTVVYVVVILLAAVMIEPVISDPQTYLLNEECSQNSTDPNFYSNFNETFDELRRKLSENNKHFAVADGTNMYALVQCRNYLSSADCLACYDDALSRMTRKCPGQEGAHVVYEGCYLRYGVPNFNNLATLPGNSGVCSNRTVSKPTEFNAMVESLLTELKTITPKINGFFVATSREVVGGGAKVYAIAQCVETLSSSGCQNCLTVAYNNINSCPPLSGGSSIDLGCFLRYSDTSFFAENQTTNITPYLKGGGSSNKTIIIGGVAGGLGILLLILALLLWYRLLRKPEVAETGDILGLTKLQGAVIYKYKDLKSATKNFSEEYKVGAGGFGDVYKGIIKNGDIVAVKKLAITTSRGKAEFDSEVRLISNVHHRNIIRLLGRSSKGPELLLVYEYMTNGSLDRFLYGEKRGTLNWKQRVDIIFGIARGLAYLHDQFHLRIIHRDIKSSNILLGDDFQPKIADFGLARLIREDQSHLSTRFAGTLGYTAPEYAIHGHLSEKVDTYSFGIVVLEIISGRRCNGMKIDEHVTESLLEYAWKLYENGIHLKLVDETLDPNEYKVENVEKIIELALMCTQSPISLRPTMSEVAVLLINDRSLEQRPLSRPTLVQSDNRINENMSTSTPSSMSNATATATVTEFTGR